MNEVVVCGGRNAKETRVSDHRVFRTSFELTSKVQTPGRIRDCQANGTVVSNGPTDLVVEANNVISKPCIREFACAADLSRREGEEIEGEEAQNVHCFRHVMGSFDGLAKKLIRRNALERQGV